MLHCQPHSLVKTLNKERSARKVKQSNNKVKSMIKANVKNLWRRWYKAVVETIDF